MTDPRIVTLETAFALAVNAPSKTGQGLAVPHRVDVEAIWEAILAALPPAPPLDERRTCNHWPGQTECDWCRTPAPALDVERLRGIEEAAQRHVVCSPRTRRRRP